MPSCVEQIPLLPAPPLAKVVQGLAPHAAYREARNHDWWSSLLTFGARKWTMATMGATMSFVVLSRITSADM